MATLYYQSINPSTHTTDIVKTKSLTEAQTHGRMTKCTDAPGAA